MKILQINKYHYVRGGSDKMYFLLSDLLTENGHEVIHFSTKSNQNQASKTEKYFVDRPDFQKLSLINKIIQSIGYIYSFKVRKKLNELLANEKPDIIHLHIFFGELSLSILPVIRKHNIPVVMSLHEYKMLCPVYTLYDRNNKLCEKCASGNYLHSISKKCNKGNLFFSGLAALESFIRDRFIPYEKYVDQFIAVSKFSLEKHLEYKPELKGEAKYLHNFVDQEAVNQISNENYFLYFGRLSREKGVLTLLMAFSKLLDLELRIVGDGPELGALMEFKKNNHLDNIKFVGFKSKNELRSEIVGARFSIIPSEWHETFGLTIIESMMCGTPVISSGLGGMAELINNGFTGFTFEAGNVENLRDIVLHASELPQAEYLKMAEDAREYAKANFTKKMYYKNLIEIYNKCLKNKCLMREI